MINENDFTVRQIKILTLLRDGYEIKRIADMLRISYPMIKFDLCMIRAKLRAKNTLHATVLAIRNKLISLD